MKKVLRILSKIGITILILIAVMVISIFTYYFITKKDSRNYLAGHSQLVLKVASIEKITKDLESSRLSGFMQQHPLFYRMIKDLKSLKKQEGTFFKNILPLLDAPVIITVDPLQRPLLIVDVGWKSLILSSGIFAVRSIYSSNRDFSISHREVNVRNENFNLYTLRLKTMGISFRFAVLGNLVFIARKDRPIINAVKAAIEKTSIYTKPNFKWVDGAVSKGNIKVIGESGGLSSWLATSNRGLGTLISRFRFFSYFAVSPQFNNQETEISGVLSTTLGTKVKNSSLEQLFNSSQYDPKGFSIIPAGFSYAAFMLVDDIKDFYDRMKLLTSGISGAGRSLFKLEQMIKDKTSSTLKQLLFDWVSHEMGIFHYKNDFVFFIRVDSPSKALKAMAQLKESGYFISPAANKYRQSLIYQIRMPFYLSFLVSVFKPSLQLPYYSLVGDYMVFSQKESSIKAVIDARFRGRTADADPVIKKMIDRFDLSSNMLIFWKSRHFSLPFLNRNNIITRLLTSQKYGLINLGFKNKALYFNVNLFD